jgi:hypothetical protein
MENAILFCLMNTSSKSRIGCYASILCFAAMASPVEAQVVEQKNRPPAITNSAPHNYFIFEPTEIRWGKELSFLVNPQDPDNDKLVLTAELGPDVAGATFDPTFRLFR